MYTPEHEKRDCYENCEHNEDAIVWTYARRGLPMFNRHGGELVGILTDCRLRGRCFGGEMQWLYTSTARELRNLAEALKRRGVSIEMGMYPESCELAGKHNGLPLYVCHRWRPEAGAFGTYPANPSAGVERVIRLTSSGVENPEDRGAGDRQVNQCSASTCFDPATRFFLSDKGARE